MTISLFIPDPDKAENPAPLEFILQGRVVRIEAGSGAVGVQIIPDEGSSRLALAF